MKHADFGRFLLALTILGLCGATIVRAQAEKDELLKQFDLSAEIYRILPESQPESGVEGNDTPAPPARDSILMDISGNGTMASPFKEGRAVVPLLSENTTINIYGSTLVLGAGSTTWNDEPVPRDPRIEILSCPRAVAIDGMPITIAIGVKDVQYFQRDPDGAYSLMTDDRFVGVSLGCTIKSGKKPGLADAAFAVSFSTIAEREPVPGVSLDVGKPVVRKAKFNTDMVVPLDHWCGLLADQNDGSVLMFLFYLKLL